MTSYIMAVAKLVSNKHSRRVVCRVGCVPLEPQPGLHEVHGARAGHGQRFAAVACWNSRPSWSSWPVSCRSAGRPAVSACSNLAPGA